MHNVLRLRAELPRKTLFAIQAEPHGEAVKITGALPWSSCGHGPYGWLIFLPGFVPDSTEAIMQIALTVEFPSGQLHGLVLKMVGIRGYFETQILARLRVIGF